MARFVKRGQSWFAQVRRKGHDSISRTFDTKAEAERWALSVESEMGKGSYVDKRESLKLSLSDCLTRYLEKIVPLKKGAVRDTQRVNVWKADKLAKRSIGSINQSDIAEWRDNRLESGVSGATVTKDLAVLSHLFTIANKEWGYPLSNPVLLITKPKASPSRDRRLYEGEEDLLINNCTQEMKSFIIIAIETAMRRSEVVNLRRAWVRGKVAYLPDTKNGSSRQVPLSTKALDALDKMPLREDGRIFSYKDDYYSKSFLKICRKVGIEGLTVHDLRHEACSRLFEKGLDVMQVKAISGHKSMQMLSRYTHLKGEDLAKLLD